MISSVPESNNRHFESWSGQALCKAQALDIGIVYLLCSFSDILNLGVGYQGGWLGPPAVAQGKVPTQVGLVFVVTANWVIGGGHFILNCLEGG